MLTVKLMNYGGDGEGSPSYTEEIFITPAKTVHAELSDIHGRTVLRIITPEESTEAYTLGDEGRNDVMYHCAYIMNSEGKTVETFRFNRKPKQVYLKTIVGVNNNTTITMGA